MNWEGISLMGRRQIIWLLKWEEMIQIFQLLKLRMNVQNVMKEKLLGLSNFSFDWHSQT